MLEADQVRTRYCPKLTKHSILPTSTRAAESASSTRVYVVTPFEMSEASIASVRGLLRREVGRLVFISGSTLSDLFSRYWPEFIVFDRHSSGTKASKVQSGGPDFFVSYNQADRKWAEWIAWTLES